MKRISLILWLAGAAAFYAFKTPVGLVFILLINALGMSLCLCATRNFFYKALSLALVVGAVLGGFCAFRLEVHSFSAGLLKKPRSLIFATHGADASAAALYQHLSGASNAGTTRKMGARLTTNAAALFTALTTGRRTYVPRALQDIVRRSGISHLLALSGFHLQVLLFFITRFQRVLPRTVFCLSACVLVWLYCLWVGFIPSLWRAAFMYSMSALGLVCMGISNFTVVWSLTGFLMMLIFPQAMSMPGFVLSMLALYGVVQGGALYARIFQSYAEKLTAFVVPKALRAAAKKCIASTCAACAVGVGAAAATMWYSMAVFGASYPIGIAASLLLTPVVVFFMIIGISLLGAQLLHAVLRFGVLEACISVLEFFMNTLSYGINALLARLAQAHGIFTWTGVLFFYAILVAICIPYCVNSSRTKAVLRLCALRNICIARRT